LKTAIIAVIIVVSLLTNHFLCADQDTIQAIHEKKYRELSNEETEELKEWLSHVEDVSIDWEYLKTCNRYFWGKGDLNNDGIEEEVGIFFQWDGEGWWSDDLGYVICIFDQNQNILYGKEVVRYAHVTGLSIEDIDRDSLQEALVSYKYIESMPSNTGLHIYGWNVKSYVKENTVIDNKVQPISGELKELLVSRLKGESFDFCYGCAGVAHSFYKADINNDGDDEYVAVSVGGNYRFLNVDGIYKEKDSSLKDIYSEIEVFLEPYLGLSGLHHGDFFIEKKGNKTYFTLVEAQGKKPEIKIDYYSAYRFLWSNKEIKLIETYKLNHGD